MRSACEAACGLQLCGAAEHWGVGPGGDGDVDGTAAAGEGEDGEEEGEEGAAFAWCSAQGLCTDPEGWVTS